MSKSDSFFIYHRNSRPTGRAIAEQLDIPFGKLRKGTSDIINCPSSVKTLIRWGNGQNVRTTAEREINSSAAIGRSSNKLSALRTLQNAGIPVPKFSTIPGELEGTVLGRSYTGREGRDIVVYADKESVRHADSRKAHDFYTQYIPNVREYRVHIFNSDVIRLQGKYLDFPGEWKQSHIKNHGQGFRFRTPDKKLNQDRLDVSIHAVEALGLNFGAVDLIVGEDKKCYVLEVNTAPACAPMTLNAYVEAFRKVL